MTCHRSTRRCRTCQPARRHITTCTQAHARSTYRRSAGIPSCLHATACARTRRSCAHAQQNTSVHNTRHATSTHQRLASEWACALAAASSSWCVAARVWDAWRPASVRAHDHVRLLTYVTRTGTARVQPPVASHPTLALHNGSPCVKQTSLALPPLTSDSANLPIYVRTTRHDTVHTHTRRSTHRARAVVDASCVDASRTVDGRAGGRRVAHRHVGHLRTRAIAAHTRHTI
jgi:hypothetical protein